MGTAITGMVWLSSIAACIGTSAYHLTMADNYQTKAIRVYQVNPDKLPYEEMTKLRGKYWGLHNQHEEDAETWDNYAKNVSLMKPLFKLIDGKE